MRLVTLGREDVEINAISDCIQIDERTYRIYFEAGCYLEMTRLQLLGILIQMERVELGKETYHAKQDSKAEANNGSGSTQSTVREEGRYTS